jgi:hypothetical protein
MHQNMTVIKMAGLVKGKIFYIEGQSSVIALFLFIAIQK